MRLAWSFTPGYIIFCAIEGLNWGASYAVGIMYLERLFDLLGDGGSFYGAATIIAVYAAYLAVMYLIHHWYWNIFNPKQREKLGAAIHNKLFQKAVSIDIARYDDPSFYNDFIWSMDSATSHVVSLVEDTGTLINRVVSITAFAGLLASIDLLMTFLIFVMAILNSLFFNKSDRVNMKFRREANEINRRNGYVQRVFSLPDYAKELRTSAISANLLRDNDAAIDNLTALNRKYANTLLFIDQFPHQMSTIVGVGLFIWLLYRTVVTGELGLGGLAVAMNAFWQVQGTTIDMVRRFVMYHQHGIFTEQMLEFLSCPNQVKYGSETAGELNEIELVDVSFGYDINKPILKELNLTIRRGDSIAIVGSNGAGKTTLTKLLLHLYDPINGVILYNGRDIREYTQSSLTARMSATFQDYRVFAASIAENVCGGEYDDSMRADVLAALDKSDFTERLKSLDKGIDTILTREFDNDGVQLSGGEAQKIAIARALYKDADLLILDEPSSSLDPESEYNLNQSIKRYVKESNKTVIFISHRLSTTRGADRIYVLDNGQIAASGSHDELMSSDNLYSRMFRVQAEKYQQQNTNSI